MVDLPDVLDELKSAEKSEIPNQFHPSRGVDDQGTSADTAGEEK